MNLVYDEGIERRIVERLRADGHSVVYVAELAPGTLNDAVLAEARRLDAPLVTKDEDFGELVFRQGLASAGVNPAAVARPHKLEQGIHRQFRRGGSFG